MRTKRWMPGRGLAFDGAVVVLLIGVALFFARDWLAHPLATTLGQRDEAHRIEHPDVMMNMAFGGWMRFAPLELHRWPLAHTDYLLYPMGSSHGTSFDSLMFGLVVGGLSTFLPLTVAYSVAVLAAFVLCGGAVYRYARYRWGRGLLALSLALTAECSPYLWQRAAIHPNLLYIWTIPLAMDAFQRFGADPSRRHWRAWVLTLPLLALSSWYNLIMGQIFMVAALVAMVWARRAPEAAAGRWMLLRRLALGWLAGMGLALLIALPMCKGLRFRAPISIETLAGYSTPLLQYLMPFPGSAAAGAPWAIHWQQRLGTVWEAYAGVPIACLLLLAAWVLLHRRAAGEARLTLGLTASLGLLLSLGPFFQFNHVLAPGAGMRLPEWYLVHLSPAFAIFKVPGRGHLLVYFAALLAAGYALHALRERYFRRGVWAGLGWPGLLAGFTVLNCCWSIPLGPLPVFPTPTVPAFYADLGRGGPGRGAILDVPFDFYLTPNYNYYQFWHKRPACSAVMFHDGAAQEAQQYLWRQRDRLFFYGRNAEYDRPEVVARLKSPEFMRGLAREGIEFVVIHADYLRLFEAMKLAHPDSAEDYRQIEAAWRGRLIYRDALIRVYRTG